MPIAQIYIQSISHYNLHARCGVEYPSSSSSNITPWAANSCVPWRNKINWSQINVTSRGSRRRDGASIVATSLQCRSYGIGPLDRSWRRRVCQSEPRLLTRRSTLSLAGVNELRRGEADVDDGRVVNTVWTDNIDNKLYVWTIPCLCLWWSSLGVGHIKTVHDKHCFYLDPVY